MASIRLKKEGKRFLIAVVLIGFASFNTGNNLIYLIFSLMLSITLISFVLAVVNLRGLRVQLSFKEPIYAETPYSLEVEVENSKAIPSYSVSIILPFEGQRLYLPSIKRGVSRRGFEGIIIRKRGRYRVKELRLMTGFPFIFMYLYKSLEWDAEVIVYPQIMDIRPLLVDMVPLPAETGRPRITHDGEFIFAREYVYGEESRRIDWKATARTQKTMMKVFSKGDERLATIILDDAGGGMEDDFEKAVSVCASLCSELIQMGYYVRLITCRKVVPFGRGRVHLFKILDILAGIRQVDAGRCPVEELSEGLSIAVLCSDSPGISGIASQCSGVIDARYI
jgi:uncharacterized protein (DUF58 family)